MIRCRSIFFLLILTVLSISCKKEDKRLKGSEYSLLINKIKKDTINEIYKGKVFYSGDELNDYTFITSSNIKNFDSLTYSIYKKNNTKDYVFSIEKLIDNQEQEKFKSLEVFDLRHYDTKNFKITSEVVNKSNKVLLLNKNTIIKEWNFPIKENISKDFHGKYNFCFSNNRSDSIKSETCYEITIKSNKVYVDGNTSLCKGEYNIMKSKNNEIELKNNDCVFKIKRSKNNYLININNSSIWNLLKKE